MNGWKNVKTYARPLPRIYDRFLLVTEYSTNAQHTTTKARPWCGATPPPSHAPLLLCVEPWLNIRWQTKNYILLA